MLQTSVKRLVTHLKDRNKDFFSFGEYKERFDNSIGIDDRYPFYFYIEDNDDDVAGEENWEEIEGTAKGSNLVSGQFKFIGAFKSINKSIAKQLIAQQMCEKFNVRIINTNSNSEAIYKDEYPDSEKVGSDMNLIRIVFELTEEVDFPICKNNLCLQDCL